MFTIISTVLSAIGKIFGLVSNVETAKITADAEVDVASTQAMASVENRWWFVSAMIVLFAMPFAVYDCKAVLWDNIIAPAFHIQASTPPLKSTLDYIHRIVVVGIFLHAVTR
jgi:hypothetical protein